MTEPVALSPPFRIRSYVCRGRRTPAQEKAYQNIWHRVGLTMQDGLFDFKTIFGREAPLFLEIGFGSGHSLLALAQAHPEWDFIGVETHQPGIGALCLGIETHHLTNIRILHADVIDVLQKIPPTSLEGIQIFFPDPWPKRRHHARRLIQDATVAELIARLKPEGSLHLATDWEDYALHMLQVLSANQNLVNMAGAQSFASRSPYRPICTRFELRALRAKRLIWDLQFKIKPLEEVCLVYSHS